MLGGHFSKSGEILIDSWLLQQGGFIDGLFNTINYDDDKDDEDLLVCQSCYGTAFLFCSLFM